MPTPPSTHNQLVPTCALQHVAWRLGSSSSRDDNNSRRTHRPVLLRRARSTTPFLLQHGECPAAVLRRCGRAGSSSGRPAAAAPADDSSNDAAFIGWLVRKQC
jgi:hypothetical protein